MNEKASEYFNSRLRWTLEPCFFDSTLDESKTHLNNLNLERLTRTVTRRKRKNENRLVVDHGHYTRQGVDIYLH